MSRKPIRGHPLSKFIGDLSNQEEHFVDSIQCFEMDGGSVRSPRAISTPCGSLPGSCCLPPKEPPLRFVQSTQRRYHQR